MAAEHTGYVLWRALFEWVAVLTTAGYYATQTVAGLPHAALWTNPWSIYVIRLVKHAPLQVCKCAITKPISVQLRKQLHTYFYGTFALD